MNTLAESIKCNVQTYPDKVAFIFENDAFGMPPRMLSGIRIHPFNVSWGLAFLTITLFMFILFFLQHIFYSNQIV